ncbi:alpha/beta fold hydrolase [Pseudoroseomonas cervicalis]|uniref:alpha/beta fold hydrolase n=1 Tax=Teichococcus cervicalis TaxID=204525 RepID=UPI0022F17F50|nr:hypothetical protein [Pseudoroseomonas cervicalis]WBV44416.1 hypothetical protein PFY06_07605 [Pseudoroseomonas cervicalis]
MPEAPSGLHAFGAYEAEFQAGPDSAHLIIAVSGVRQGGGPEAFDLRGVLPRPGGDVVFLRDRLRSWYNAAEGWDALLDALRGFAAARPYQRVALVGAGMGGYGALLLAEALPQALVVALSPSIGVDTARYGRGVARPLDWIDAAPALPRPEARLQGDPQRYLLLFGDQDVLDIQNARQFHDQGWRNLYVCADAPHGLAEHLRRPGRLERLLDRLARGEPASAQAAATGAYLAFSHCPAFLLLEARRLLYAGEMMKADLLLGDIGRSAAAPAQALGTLRQLRNALERVDAARLERFLAGPLQQVRQKLTEGWEAQYSSTEAVLLGGAASLGPLALLRLWRPGRQGEDSLTLRFRADPPPASNQGGARKLAAYTLSPEGPQRLPLEERPGGELSAQVTAQDGVAELLLQRRCFHSTFDAERGGRRQMWAMRVTPPALS